MKQLTTLFLCAFLTICNAQENLTYQQPHQDIMELADAKMAPQILMDNAGENIVFLYRDGFKSISELSEEEMRLGGLRINPKTNIGSRTRFSNDIKIRNGRDGAIMEIAGLPSEGRYAYFSWSPDENTMVFTNTTTTGTELWALNIDQASAKKLTEDDLNANMGRPFVWFKDSESLLVKKLPGSRKALIDTKEAVPTGPTVSVSEAGVKAQNRTYQDLLKNKND